MAHKFTSKLENQNVLIIGGTGGVGMGAAAGLLSFGANIILTSSRQPKLDEKLKELRDQFPDAPPHSITGFTCDLAPSDKVEENLSTLIEQVSTHLDHIGTGTGTTGTNPSTKNPKLNHLIYTAGDSLALHPITEITSPLFHEATQVRAISALVAVKLFSPLLPQTNKSSITLTGGAICDKPFPGGWSMVAFVGAGLNGMMRVLAADLAPVRVNLVAPGAVDTGLWGHMDEKERDEFYQGIRKAMKTGEVGTPEDVGEAYLYLLRDYNVTGAVVHTNGGTFL